MITRPCFGWCSGAQQATNLHANNDGQVLREPTYFLPRWRHPMETFSALLALGQGNPPVTDGFPYKGQRRGALVFSLICASTNNWANNRDAGDLRRHRAHCDVTVMHKLEMLPHGNDSSRRNGKLHQSVTLGTLLKSVHFTSQPSECHGVSNHSQLLLFVQQRVPGTKKNIMKYLHYWPLVRENHRRLGASPHKGPVKRKSSWIMCFRPTYLDLSHAIPVPLHRRENSAIEARIQWLWLTMCGRHIRMAASLEKKVSFQ